MQFEESKRLLLAPETLKSKHACFAHTIEAYIECKVQNKTMDVGMSGQVELPDEKLAESEDKGFKKKNSCCFRAVGCRFKGGKSNIQQHETGCVGQHLNLLMDEVMTLNQKAISVNLQPDMSRSVMEFETEASKVQSRNVDFQKEHQINEVGKEMQQYCKLIEETKQCVTVVETKLTAFNDTLTALSRKVDTCSRIAATVNGQIQLNNQQFNNVEDKLTNVASRLCRTEQVIQKTAAQMMALETMTETGIFIWKIPQIKQRLEEAIDGTTPYLDSSEFYLCKYGYKMCLRIYLNGHGEAQGSYISLYYILLKGQYDALIQWPFKENMKLALLNQRDRQQSILKIYVPNEHDSALQRPGETMSALHGFAMFVTLTEFNQRFSEFVAGDEMFVGAEVIPVD